MQSRIDQLDKVEKIKELPPIQMELAAAIPATNKTLISCQQLDGSIGDKTLWDSPVTFNVHNGEKNCLNWSKWDW